MGLLSSLEPAIIWNYFEKILEIPRPSRKEEKIREFLISFAKSTSLSYKTDQAGNLIISKEAYKGYEDRQMLTLQSHMDMVGENNSDIKHDFNKDPIIPQIIGSWIKASGTTLGADDGIGIAAQLAVLASDDIEHGPLECLFTVDEETGLTGANELQPGFVEGSILLNLDSEDEGELFIGCAGGIDTLITFEYKKDPVPQDHMAFDLNVGGLMGGHSGDDIHKGYGNSNKILSRFLWETGNEYEIRINIFEGGNLRNAIPREAKIIGTIPKQLISKLKETVENFEKIIKDELRNTESNLFIIFNEIPVPEFVIDKKSQFNLLNSLHSCPNGVIEWSREISGLVETSTNLASIRFTEENRILITTSQRSSIETAKKDIANRIAANFQLAGAVIEHTDGYPGWKPNVDSQILKIASASYKKLFHQEPKVKAIHAGLECGLFLEKYPDLDMISFGPTIKGAHSPDERLNIESTGKFWMLLLEILKSVPTK